MTTRISPMRVALLGAMIVLMSGALPGCWVSKKIREAVAPKKQEEPKLTEQDLELLLEQFATAFNLRVRRAADHIIAECGADSAIHRRAIEWKLEFIPFVWNAVTTPDVRLAFMNTWIVTSYMVFHFTEDAGKDDFGELQTLAIDVANRLEDEIEEIATAFIPEKQLEKAREDVSRFVRNNPIGIGGSGGKDSVTWTSHVRSSFTWLAKVPLAPFRAFGGISEGAAAVRQVASVVERSNRVVEGLPSTLRWEIQLLLLDVNESGLLVSLTESFKVVAEAATRIATVVESLPEELRAEILGLLDDADPRLAEIRAAIGDANAVVAESRAAIADVQGLTNEVNATVARVETALGAVDDVAGTLETISGNVNEAGDSWDGAITTFDGLMERFGVGVEDPDAEPTPPAPVETEDGEPVEESPGGLELYAIAAEQTANAGDNLKGALDKFDGMIRDDEFAERLDRARMATERSVEGASDAVVDRIAWRSIQVIVIGLLLLFVYRAAVRRFLPPPGS